MTLLHTATVDGRTFSSRLHDGDLLLLASTPTGSSPPIRLTLAEADAVATFLRTSIDRALLHGARKEAP